jgi:hypothetical protein
MDLDLNGLNTDISYELVSYFEVQCRSEMENGLRRLNSWHGISLLSWIKEAGPGGSIYNDDQCQWE